MSNRCRKLGEPPSLSELLRDAQPTLAERLRESEAAGARRVEALTALLSLARSALANADEWHNIVEGKPHEPRSYLGAIAPELRRFLETAGLRILTAENPIAVLQRFLGQRGRGRRPAGERRNVLIAADVAELHAGGMSFEAAYEEVSKRAEMLGCRQVERIHLRLRDDLGVRAELEWRAMVRREGEASVKQLKARSRTKFAI
jgi:hypothetical protein